MPFRNDVKLAFVVLLAMAVLLSGCGPGGKKPLHKDRPAPAPVGEAIPFTPVGESVDLAPFRVDPCAALKREDIAALITDPPDEVRSNRPEAGMVGCSWNIFHGPLLTVFLPTGKEKTLSELSQVSEREPSLYSGWRELSLVGLPVAQYHSSDDPKSCDLAVGTSDDAMLQLSYQVNDKSQYWGDDRCAAALKAAEFVIGNLRGR